MSHVLDLIKKHCFIILYICVILIPKKKNILFEIYQWLIQSIDNDTKRKLLYGEDVDGLRPLELAAAYGFFKLVKAILETEDVYLVEDEYIGAMRYQRFDITDYEGFHATRSHKSPLGFITFMNNVCLSKPMISDLFSWRPMEQWYKMKAASSLPLVCVWFVLRFSTLLLYYALMGSRMQNNVLMANLSSAEMIPRKWCDGEVDLTFSSGIKIGLLWYITLYSFLVLCLDIFEVTYVNMYRKPYVIYRMCRRCNTVVSMWFHRISQHIMSWIFALGGVTMLLGLESKYQTTSEILNVCAAVGHFGSTLYFLQMVPSIGHNIITVKRMLSDLLNFGVLFVMCVAPFARYFFIFFANNSNEGCIEHFATLTDSFYSTITIMLNMVNFNDFDVQNKIMVRLAHFCFVFIIAILLVNFLIALMSNSASEISQNRLLGQKLERLHVAMVLEYRFGWLLKNYYSWNKRRCGMIVDERVLLTNIQLTSEKQVTQENN